MQRLWQRGDILAAMAKQDSSLFPRRLRLKTPRSADMLNHFDEVRRWISELQRMPHIRLEMQHFHHPQLGDNEKPVAVWIDSAAEALALTGHQRDARRFEALLTITRQRQPSLLAWLARRPLRALELHQHWQHLLDVVDWFITHPRPGIYVRQVDIPGIDSKFIEAHRRVLSELLDLVLPASAIDHTATGVTQFTRRYGLCEKPVRIRFRMLDTRHNLLPGEHTQDMTLDYHSFACLQPGIRRVFITENEINYLAFPPQDDSMVIFGAGYGLDLLARTPWLQQADCFYWGDIDTHGFAILNELRQHLPAVQSLLMDRQTLMQHRPFWGHEARPVRHELTHLSDEEAALYDDLRYDRIHPGLRLEQERIAFGLLPANGCC